jgi:hypothetical protein
MGTRAEIHEMDAMGAWRDDGTAWLPRSRYTRAQARTFYARECGAPWIEVSVLARFMRHAPDEPEAREYDGDFWRECKPDVPGAFPVWRCE